MSDNKEALDECRGLSISVGADSNLQILRRRITAEGAFEYVDAVGEHMTCDKRIVAEAVVIAGRWWHAQHAWKFPSRQPDSRNVDTAS